MAETSAVPAPAPRIDFGASLFVGLACLGDILLLRAWLLGQLTMIEIIGLHGCVALAVGACALLARRRLPQHLLVSAVLLILFGPLGGPALMIVTPVPAVSRPRVSGAVRPAAPRTLTTGRADEIFSQIRQGRRRPLPQQALQNFPETFRAGSLHQQLEAIAAISRGYHPDMRPALSAALASPVPAIRVQAAAVYAKLRGSYQARAKELLAQSGTDVPPSDREWAEACLAVAQSGFVDSDTRNRLQDLSRQVAEAAPSDVPSRERDLLQPKLRPALQPAPRLKRHACGGLG